MTEDIKTESVTSLASVSGDAPDIKKTATKFKSAKREFIRWLATPEALRSPVTAREFAAQRGVAESTLSVWKGRPEVEGEVRRLVMAESSIEIADILAALKRAAKGGSTEAIRLWFEFVLGWVRGAPTNIAVQTNVEVSFGDEARGFWNSPDYKKSIGSEPQDPE